MSREKEKGREIYKTLLFRTRVKINISSKCTYEYTITYLNTIIFILLKMFLSEEGIFFISNVLKLFCISALQY